MKIIAQNPVLMNAPFGFASYQVVYNDDGKPVECRFLQVNKVFENITGLKGKNVLGKTLKEVMPGFLDDQFDWISHFAEIAEQCTAKTIEQFSNSLGKWLKIHVSAVKKGYLELYIDEISHEHYFAQAVKELTEFTIQNIDYGKIANWMREISGAEYVGLNKFDKEGKSFTTVGLSGISANIERAVQLLGFQLEGKKWDYDQFRERQIKESKITRFSSIGELTSHVFSKPLIKLIETTFYIGEMVLAKTTKDDKLVGDFTLIFGKNRHLKNTAMVEAFADIAGSTMARIDTEQALLESEGKYRMIAENSSDVIWLMGLDLQFIYVSPSTTRLFGYTIEERKNITLSDLLPSDELMRIKSIIAGEMENYKKTGTKKAVLIETTGKHKNGNLLFLEVSATFVFDDNGNINAVQGITRDIAERKKYEQDLLSVKEEIEISEKKHKHLLNNLHAAVVVHNTDTKITFCNQKASEILGININNYEQRDAYSGEWNFLDGYGNKLSADQFPVVEVLRTGNAVENQIIGIVHPNGDLIWGQVNAYPEYDAKSELKQVVVTFIDITNLKETEIQLFESEARFKALHNASFGGLVIHDKGIILDCNLGLAKMTGFTVDELVGMNGLLLIAEQTREMVLHNILAGVEHPYEAVGLRKDGTTYPLRLEGRNIPYKGKNVRSVEFRDVTIQKNYETELIIAKEKAEESDRLKSAFLANMSHEIRTPMNGILGFTELLNEPGLNSEQKQQYINIIQKSGQRMLNTVNDLIDISKIETGQMPVVKSGTNIKEQLQNLFSFFIPEAREKGIQLILKDDIQPGLAVVETDVAKLDSILTNLIKNAIKYTDSGNIEMCGTIENQQFEFFVKDTGIGIPKNRQSAIFNRFEQADIADTRALQGSGLGLAITKAYVEMLEGKIWLESDEGVGATFYISIPVTSTGELNTTTDSYNKSNSNETKKLKIVIAEDDEAGFYYLEAILRAVECEIIHCYNGQEVVDFCRNNPDTNLILMDIRMPVLNGYEAASEIRKFNKKVVIIAQTAFALSGDKEKAMAAGCNDYLSKPIKKADLLSTINLNIEKVR